MAVYAEVALKSKLPNDLLDYRVIAKSRGALDTKDFEAIFLQLAVGNPQSETSLSVTQAPWITFGPYEKDGVRHIAGIRQDFARGGDAHGSRQILAMVCICLPYQQFAEAGLSLLDLASNLASYSVATPQMVGAVAGSGQASSTAVLSHLEIKAMSQQDRLAVQAALIDRTIGFDFAAKVAALLTCAPVALRGDEISLDLRLGYLDAIVALLPFGARADLTISNWVQSSTPHKIRLGFTDAARQGQQRVVWGQPPTDSLIAFPASGDYSDLLSKLRGHFASTHNLITALATLTEPLTFDAPEAFVEALRKVDWPYTVWEEARAGRANPADIHSLFASETAARLEDSQRADLLKFLLSKLEQPAIDVTILAENWDQMGVHRETLWQALIERTQQDVLAIDLARLYALADLAGHVGNLHNLLEHVIGFSDKVARSGNTSRPYRAAAAVVARYLRRLDPAYQVRIRNVVVSSEALFVETATALIVVNEKGQASKQDLEWLSGGDSGLFNRLEPIAIAAGLAGGQLTQVRLAPFANLGSPYVRMLLKLALDVGNNGSTARIMPVILNWLLGQASDLDEVEHQRWQVLLPNMAKAADSTPELKAGADALYLVLEPITSAPFFGKQLAGSREDFMRYLAALGTSVQLTGHNTAVARQVLKSAIQIASKLGSTSYSPQGQNGAVTAYDNLSALIDEMMKEQSPLNPKDPSSVARLQLSNIRKNTRPQDIAVRCANVLALDKTSGLDFVIHKLSEKQCLSTVADFKEFSNTLQASLQSRTDPKLLDSIRATLSEAVLNGTFGSKLTNEFLTVQVQEIRRHMAAIRQIFTMIGDRISEDEQRSVRTELDALKKIHKKGIF